MTSINWKKLAVAGCAGLVALGAMVVCGTHRVRADGIPTSGALTYSAVLEDPDGAPASGTKEIKLSLFDAESGGAEKCTVTKTATLANGRFSLLLPDTCTKATRDTAVLWVDVSVDGTSLGRTKLGAVPYAVESARASEATGALKDQVVPAGAVMPFALAACPAGWSAFADANGRVIVGTGPGVTLNQKLGADSVTLTTAQLPAHSHGVSDPGHLHQVPNTINYNINPAFQLGGQGVGQATINSSAALTNISIESAGGGQAFDNRQASLGLLYCKKN